MSKPSAAIHYDLCVSSIASHLFDVTLTIAKPNKGGQLLTLPAWIPGSYMIRDFAKSIVSLSATDESGHALRVQKQDKQSWSVEQAKGQITIHYQVYAYDLSVRGAYINDEIAFFNGTNMFLAVEGQTEQPCGLSLQPPNQPELAHWRVATTMPTDMLNKDQFGDYWANDYAELIDHPVLLGEFDILPFNVADVEFELILAGGHQADVQRITSDLVKICQHHITFFDDLAPIKRYQFITLLTDNAFGGLEHISSTALMYSRHDLPDNSQVGVMTEGYRNFLSLCSHEFFHTWHVKRIKPQELFNAPLTSEQYTEQLWIYEGFTSYYDDFSLLNCKVIDQPEYLKVVGQNLTRLLRNKGRLKQSITQSSFDAWTKFYKQDESAINNIVSYYNKGAVVAMCLDLLIRHKSQSKFSLQDVMQQLWQQHGRVNIPTDIDVIQQITQQKLNIDLSEFLHQALYTTNELPVQELLNNFGIELIQGYRENLDDKGGEPNKSTINIEFGAQVKPRDLGVEIVQVSEGTAAHSAGMMVGDILIAMDNWQVSKERLKPLLNNLSLGQSIELCLLRDKKLKRFNFVAVKAVPDSVSLAVLDAALCAKWLG
jgi:predicted metalloprotease with PDZ domain